MRPGREALLVVLACALLYLTGTADIPFYTRGEPREGLVVREMLARSAWLVPTRPDGEPTRKPPLYYWLAAPARAALPGHEEFSLRLPSAVCATAAVLATWATARAIFGAAAGLPAALVLATAFEWVRAATSARVDMVLAAALTAALCGWMLALEGRRRAWLAVAAAGITLGVLAKGPLALVLPALPAATLLPWRHEVGAWRRLRPLHVLVTAGALAGLWYAAAYLHAGPKFLDVLARENWRRFLDPESAEAGHAHGILYLVPLGLVGLLPWPPLLPLAAVPLVRPRRPAALLAAAWFAAGFVFFSLAAGKRSVYLLPLYPALALLVGAGVASASSTAAAARLAGRAAALYGPALTALALVTGAFAAGFDPGALVRPLLRPADAAGAHSLAAAAHAATLPFALLALGTATGAALAARAARARRWQRLVVVVAALAIAWTATFNTWLHPAIARDRSLEPFLTRIAHLVPDEAPLYAIFPPDPGLRFYAPRALRPLRRQGLPEGGHVLLWEDEWGGLRTAGGGHLPVVARSEVRRSRHGALLLASAPPGQLVAEPEVRTGGPPR